MATYYTAFMFKFERDPNVLHCTHKYLGDLGGYHEAVTNLQRIQGTITSFFAVRGLERLPAAVFNVEDFFKSTGPNKTIQDVRVLKPNIVVTAEYQKRLYPDLKTALDHYRKDDFEWNPHVTTNDFALIQSEFKQYVLVRNDGVIIKSWDL